MLVADGRLGADLSGDLRARAGAEAVAVFRCAVGVMEDGAVVNQRVRVAREADKLYPWLEVVVGDAGASPDEDRHGVGTERAAHNASRVCELCDRRNMFVGANAGPLDLEDEMRSLDPE